MAPLMNKNKEVFGGDVDVFRPERWLTQDPEKLKSMERTILTVSRGALALQSSTDTCSLIQFGHGSRSCIGKNIALLEITKLVPQILRYYDVAWASPSTEWTTYSYWFCVQKDVKLRFTSRVSKS